ncbi:TraB/GumN family protein [Candidatus Woesearchaeota archaeon]|nr:TraB/GumN family protein [Candidatus Woesearchaeota archaeon]
MDNIRIVGTSHISPDSLKTVRKTIEEFQPDFVAVELDKKRLVALMQKGKKKGPGLRDIKRLGFKGWVFGALGSWVERSLGKKVGVSPGDEMIAAIRCAAQNKAKIALIDRDIEITLRRFSKALSWKEKWNFFIDIIKGLFGFSSLKFDISKVPPKEVISKLLAEVKKRYPNVYRVLISERNVFMAKAIASLVESNPDARIVAVVGAGHEEDIQDLLQKYLKK